MAAVQSVSAAGTRVPLRRPDQARTLTRWYLANERIVLGLAGVLLVLGAWEAASQLKLGNAVLLSSPSAVARVAAGMYTSPSFLENLQVSGYEFAVGYAIAALVGLLLGLAVGWYRTLSDVVEPYITSLYSIPKAALLPLFLLWLGVGVESKIGMVFLWAVFPVVISTIAGVRALEGQFVRVARSFDASDGFLFRSVILPGTVPFILTGLRLSVARGLVGLVTAELYGANAGIGYLVTFNGAQFRIPQMLAGVVVIAAFGVGGTQLLYRVERAFDRWRPSIGG